MEPSPERTVFEEELRSLEQICARISQLLGPAGHRRVTGDIERRCLALVEMEMSGIVASLKSYPLTLRDDAYYESLGDNPGGWLRALVRLAERILESASADPPRHTLLDKAVVYCRRRNPNPSRLLNLTEEFLILAEDPRRYMLHLLPSRDIDELLPHEEEAVAGGVPLVGIDRPIKYLLSWLAPESKALRVMSVVGPVGIGKTTLARELHNKCQTDGDGPYCFHFKFMVRLSKRRDGTKLLLQEILSQISNPAALALSSDHPRPMGTGLLVSCVSELLQNKRYFICIDDITNAVQWEQIKYAFPNNGFASRILITSHVGSATWSSWSYSNVLVHEMKPLNQVDSERLLITRAFGSLDAVPPDSVKLLNKILMRCDGIPLLVNGMADWLKDQIQLQGHRQYEEELDSRVPKQLVSALSSAFDDLPYDLKIISLNMSMFPYGHKFGKHRLVSMFPYGYRFDKYRLAKVYCRKDRYDKHPEESRMLNISELVDRNIITRVAATSKNDPDEDEWHVNHFMHQFLVHKSAENSGFGFTSDTVHYLKELPAAKVPRRLALHNPNPIITSLLARETLYFSEIRSLAVSGAVSGIPFSKFINLLELDLEGWVKLSYENLQEVCKSKMFFLQYLSVRNTRVTKLPQEIKDLCNLKVLDISYTYIRELPLEVFRLEFLDELDLRGTWIRQLPKQIVWLRRSLSGLLLLGHAEGRLNSFETRVPHDIVCLRELQTLATIDLSEQPASFVNAFGDLPRLRVLAITWSFHQCTDQAYREALLSSIENWCYLKSLTIHCGLGCSMEFLGSLFNSPKKLEKFKVTAGRFASVPKWISELPLLSFVQITVCKQSTEDLKVLGGLPRLQCLILGLDFIPLEAVVIESESFPRLQWFSVDCPNPWLSFSTGAMWNLTYLQLKLCAIPASKNSVPSGLECLGNLTKVTLHYSVRYANSPNVKNTVAAVREQVANHLYPIDLFINEKHDYDVQAAVDKEVETEDGAQPVDEEVVKTTPTTQTQSTCEIEEVKSHA